MPKVLPSTPSGGGRLARGRRVSTTLAEINIIPLVDVMLVLLIIFMVAAPMMQRGVEISLPVATRSPEISSERIFVDVPAAFAKDRRVYIDKEPVRLEILGERVRQLMINRSDKKVFLRIDGRLTIQNQMDVAERLNEGGVEQYGIVTKLPGER